MFCWWGFPRSSFWDSSTAGGFLRKFLMGFFERLFRIPSPSGIHPGIFTEIPKEALSGMHPVVIPGIPLGTSSRISLEIPSGISPGISSGISTGVQEFLQEFSSEVFPRICLKWDSSIGFLGFLLSSVILSGIFPEIPKEVVAGMPPGVIPGIALETASGISLEIPSGFFLRISSGISSGVPEFLQDFSSEVFP